MNEDADKRVIKKQIPTPSVVKKHIVVRMALVEGKATFLIKL